MHYISRWRLLRQQYYMVVATTLYLKFYKNILQIACIFIYLYHVTIDTLHFIYVFYQLSTNLVHQTSPCNFAEHLLYVSTSAPFLLIILTHYLILKISLHSLTIFHNARLECLSLKSLFLHIFQKF